MFRLSPRAYRNYGFHWHNPQFWTTESSHNWILSSESFPVLPLNLFSLWTSIIYTRKGVLLSHKKEGDLAPCDHMEGPWGHYAKWNMSDRVSKDCMILLMVEVEVKVAQSCPDSLPPRGLYGSWNSPGQNTGVDSLSLLQGIFLTQGSNSGLPHCRWILYQLSHKGRPISLIGGI